MNSPFLNNRKVLIDNDTGFVIEDKGLMRLVFNNVDISNAYTAILASSSHMGVVDIDLFSLLM